MDPWPSQFVALFFRDKTPLDLSDDVRIAASVVQSKSGRPRDGHPCVGKGMLRLVLAL